MVQRDTTTIRSFNPRAPRERRTAAALGSIKQLQQEVSTHVHLVRGARPHKPGYMAEYMRKFQPTCTS